MLKKPAEETKLDQIIEELEDHILTEDLDSKDYKKMVTNLETLYKLREGNKPKHQLELKDWIPVIGSIGGILVIVTFEAFGHTVATKGLGFVSKLKS